MNPRITDDLYIIDVIEYLSHLELAVSKIKSCASIQGKSNISWQNIGKFIFEQFKQHFNTLPKTGKGRRPYDNDLLFCK